MGQSGTKLKTVKETIIGNTVNRPNKQKMTKQSLSIVLTGGKDVNRNKKIRMKTKMSGFSVFSRPLGQGKKLIWYSSLQGKKSISLGGGSIALEQS